MAKPQPGPAHKLILECNLPPGDLVVLTAAVRDLHYWHPGRFVTDVRTPFPELWENNPHITPLLPDDPDTQTLVCGVRLIDHSHRLPCHYLYGFLDFLSVQLGVGIEPSAFRGDIHLSPAEQSCPTVIEELTGSNAPYWLVSAGGKHDLTIKWWSADRYQQVVSHFKERVLFVQVGRAGDHHPTLKGVLDLRGRTTLRQLIRLVYHAQGVLCGVTALMHLAAAVPQPPNRPGLRPAVIIVGGREPPHWVGYPGHQLLHTIAALPCCATGACWKARTIPLGDDNPLDTPPHLCVDVRANLPHCMHLITANDVTRKIESCVHGGQATFLNPTEKQTAQLAITRAGPSRFDDLPLSLSGARLALHKFLTTLPTLTPTYAQRGIVICAGGARFFTNAWVCISILRHLGCQLPIQLWHLDPSELDPAMRRLLASLNVQPVNASSVRRQHPTRTLGFWEIKPYAILHSPFRDVLLLDADNVPARDPAFLFDSQPYHQTGALFWPDRGRDPGSLPAWRSCGVPPPPEPGFESGQLLVDKHRCWPALRLALWFNEHSDFYYRYLYGDKDTFQLAFRTLNTPYSLVPHPPQTLPGRMNQHHFDGSLLFQHRSEQKWSLLPHPQNLPGFQLETECLAALEHLRQVWDGRRAWLRRQFPKTRPTPSPPQPSPASPPSLAIIIISCPERTAALHATLADFATTDAAHLPLETLIDPERTPDRTARIIRQTASALSRFLAGPADHLLFLEDDLRFNRFLLHNLNHWRPLRTRHLSLASLYNPGVREIAYDLPNHALAVDPIAAYGSQAFLISRPAAHHTLQHWHELDCASDLRLLRLAAQLPYPIYYHAPSLVQHAHSPSTWGGRPHQAIDFDPLWKSDRAIPSRPHPPRRSSSNIARAQT
jgi:putative component of toxin-antitoxin plasmid stabilization module